MGETTFEALKEKALSLPLKPGVYLMMDREGTVIYAVSYTHLTLPTIA